MIHVLMGMTRLVASLAVCVSNHSTEETVRRHKWQIGGINKVLSYQYSSNDTHIHTVAAEAAMQSPTHTQTHTHTHQLPKDTATCRLQELGIKPLTF